MSHCRLQRLEVLVNRLAAAKRRPPPAKPLKTIHDVIELLDEQVQAVRADPNAGTLEKARLIGYLSSIAGRIIKTGELADYLQLMEELLKERPEKGNA